MGRVPIAQAQRGKGHKDRELGSLALARLSPNSDGYSTPFCSARVELSFLLNPQSYHGPLRIATGLTIANSLVGFEKHAAEIEVPIKAIHGADDRITNPKSTEQFIRDCKSVDKEVEIWPGYEVRLPLLSSPLCRHCAYKADFGVCSGVEARHERRWLRQGDGRAEAEDAAELVRLDCQARLRAACPPPRMTPRHDSPFFISSVQTFPLSSPPSRSPLVH